MSTELQTGAQAPNLSAIGIHVMPFETYVGIKALNQSRLKSLARSPKHCKFEMDNPSEPSSAMRVGSVADTAIFDPDLLFDLYAVKPKFDLRRTADKELSAAFDARNSHKTIVKQDEWDRANEIASALHADDDCRQLIEAADKTQVTGIWKDEETGLLCKLRADAICSSIGVVYDLKTTRDASRYAFEKSIFDYRCYWQAAWYLDGLKALGLNFSHYCIIAVENEAPHCPKVYRLQDEVIDLARRELLPLKRLYAKCLRENKWPGYPSGVEDIGLPGYAINRIEKEIM